MIIEMAGNLKIKNPPNLSALTNQLQIKNQSYQQALRRNPHARFYLSEYIKYYSYDKASDTLTVPRGLISKITGEIEDKRTLYPSRFVSTIKLRPYQRGIPEAMAKHDQGIIRLDTGYGKTIIAIRMAELLKQKTLFIVPTIGLLNQFVYEIRQWTDQLPGIIQGKECTIKTLTVACLPSLRNRIRDNNIQSDEFGAVFVDECHKFVPEKSRSVVEFFSAHYRFGLTATLGRSDGQGEAIHFLFGKKLCDHRLPQATPDVQFKEFEGYIPVDEYFEIINAQVNNQARNQLIADTAIEQIKEGRKILILTKRITHYEQIATLLTSHRVYQIRADAKAKERKRVLHDLREGNLDYDVILGTYPLLGTGFNMPSLDTLIFAGDLKSKILARQSAGRILRIFDNKERPRIIDIVDRGNPILFYQSKERKSFYRDEGWL